MYIFWYVIYFLVEKFLNLVNICYCNFSKRKRIRIFLLCRNEIKMISLTIENAIEKVRYNTLILNSSSFFSIFLYYIYITYRYQRLDIDLYNVSNKIINFLLFSQPK